MVNFTNSMKSNRSSTNGKGGSTNGAGRPKKPTKYARPYKKEAQLKESGKSQPDVVEKVKSDKKEERKWNSATNFARTPVKYLKPKRERSPRMFIFLFVC